MKYLTPIYIQLMYQFVKRTETIPNKYFSDIELMSEYFTLRLDGGRCSGKTTATTIFAEEWLKNGNDIITLSKSYNASQIINKSLRKHATKNNRVVSMSIRKFLSDDIPDAFRGVSFKKTLVIIDEPIKIPDMNKFYKKFSNGFHSEFVPLFFVIGMQ